MLVARIIMTIVAIFAFGMIWRFITTKGRRLFLKAKALSWVLSTLLFLIGLWVVLNIWEVIPLFTNTAVLGVWFFFFMWYIKDLFFDSFFAGIKLTALGKLKPGDRIKLMGEECTVEEIGATETILKSGRGLIAVPNSKIAHDAIIYKAHEKPEAEDVASHPGS
jgi:small-conductance mechanosensitive channel